MQIIKRDYLQKLIDVIGTPDIKVVTGVRRSGKSVLLGQLADYIKANVPHANLITVNFNSLDYENLREYHALNNYIESRYQPKMRNFVLIDEVQMCEKFEYTINSLHDSQKYDIYITGSNAFLLSSDLATLFTGRTYSLEVFPFSYREYLACCQANNRKAGFDDYLFEGGLAGTFSYPKREQKYQYIREVYDTMIVRDIVQKYDLRRPETLEAVSDFMLSNIAKECSLRSIADTLTSETGQNNYHSVVGNYLNYLCNAYAFYKVSRYDIQGKQYLASQDKYYVSDHGFRFAKLGIKTPDYGKILENIVAIELLRRGYELYVGVLRDGEVDFIAIKQDQKFYVQVSYSIEDERTRARELNSLLAIRDAYPKFLITRTHQPEYVQDGVRVIDVEDWLTRDEDVF